MEGAGAALGRSRGRSSGRGQQVPVLWGRWRARERAGTVGRRHPPRESCFRRQCRALGDCSPRRFRCLLGLGRGCRPAARPLQQPGAWGRCSGGGKRRWRTRVAGRWAGAGSRRAQGRSSSALERSAGRGQQRGPAGAEAGVQWRLRRRPLRALRRTCRHRRKSSCPWLGRPKVSRGGYAWTARQQCKAPGSNGDAATVSREELTPRGHVKDGVSGPAHPTLPSCGAAQPDCQCSRLLFLPPCHALLQCPSRASRRGLPGRGPTAQLGRLPAGPRAPGRGPGATPTASAVWWTRARSGKHRRLVCVWGKWGASCGRPGVVGRQHGQGGWIGGWAIGFGRKVGHLRVPIG